MNVSAAAPIRATILAPTAATYAALLAARFPDMVFLPATNEAEARAAMPECEILIAFGIAMTDDILRAGPKLRWIQSLATGVDKFQTLPSLRPEVVLTSARGIHEAQVGEMAVMLMVALNRQLPRLIESQRAHRWDRFPAPILAGKTAVVWGVGVIGTEIARLCKAFRMTVWGVTRTPREIPHFDRLLTPDRLGEAAAAADYLIAIAPGAPEHVGRLDREVLGRMKPTAFVINLGRGELINDADLIDALRRERIAGAALDVFAPEPLAPDHPYWDMDNVIITPHCAGMSVEYEEQAVALIAENIEHFRAGAYDRMVNRVS